LPEKEKQESDKERAAGSVAAQGARNNPNKCSNCGQPGHNKRSCTPAASDAQAVLANESGVEPAEPNRPPAGVAGALGVGKGGAGSPLKKWTDDAVHPFPPSALGGFTDKELIAMHDVGLGHVNWNGKQYPPEQWEQKVAQWERLFPHIKDENGNTKHPNETANDRTTAQRNGRDVCWQKLPQTNIRFPKECPEKLRKIFRVDMYGNVVADPDHTSDSALCWFDVDHCFPWCRGGRSVQKNFAAVQWDANRRVKSDKLIQTLHKDKMSCGLQLEQFEALMEHVKNQDGRRRDTTADFDKVKYWLTTSPKNGVALSNFQGKFSAWKKSQNRSDGFACGQNLWDFFEHHFDEAAPVAGC